MKLGKPGGLVDLGDGLLALRLEAERTSRDRIMGEHCAIRIDHAD